MMTAKFRLNFYSLFGPKDKKIPRQVIKCLLGIKSAAMDGNGSSCFGEMVTVAAVLVRDNFYGGPGVWRLKFEDHVYLSHQAAWARAQLIR